MKKYIFYKISCLDETIDYIYIGSTQDFIRRKYEHKNCCINERSKHYNLQVYKFIRENGGWKNFQMIPIDECEFETKLHARIHEQKLIEKFENRLNVKNAYTNEKNKDKIREYQKEYYKENKQSISGYQKNYRLMKKLEKLVENHEIQEPFGPQFETTEVILE